jgi:pimeloyl-ACP methyl ester carboxylesterase
MAWTEGAVPLWWEEQGSGEPLLLVMGHIYGMRMWHRVVPALAQHYRVISFDNRGIGQSPPAAGPHSIADMADDAFAVLDAAGVDAAHVYGASMGGLIAQEMALARPERVRSLVLGCTGCPSDETAPSARFAALKYRIPLRLFAPLMKKSMYGSGTDRALIEEDVRILLDIPVRPSALATQARGIAAYRSRSRVSSIEVPVLVLHGTEDKVVPVERGEELHEAVPHSQLVRLEGAGHNYTTDATTLANQAVLDFLRTQQAPAIP